MGSTQGTLGKMALLMLFVILLMFAAVAMRNPRPPALAFLDKWLPLSSTPAESPSPSPAPSAATPAPSATTATNATTGLQPAAGQSVAFSQDQQIIKNFMRQHAAPDCTITFLDWPGFSTTGLQSNVTVRYRVQEVGHPDVEAMVQFTIQNGNITKTALVHSTAPQPIAASAPRYVAATPRPFYVDHFSSKILAAEHGPAMTLHLNDAYSLSQLDQAKQTARAEGKPLGFLMVWGQFFNQPPDDTQDKSSVSALVHFWQIFHDNVVFVFVRHESELGSVPPAVSKGFGGPDEGGYAPNMAVTDATATEFITEIPYRGLDGPGRTPIFAAGAKQIDTWLATHPGALPTPAAAH